MSFDPNEFLHSEVEGEMDTEIIQPEPGEYPAYIDSLEVVSGTSEKTGEDWYALNVAWNLSENEEVLEHCGRDKVTVRQRIFLDMEDDGKGNVKLSTAKGKNIQLGRLREAVGMNEGKFSPSMLEGARAKVRVRQNTLPDGAVVAQVQSVASLD